jgi:hypothetical protein
MIILFKGHGYYSNRLFQNLHFEAFCIEHKIPYANATFSDIHDYYLDPAFLINNSTTRLLGNKLCTPLIRLKL